MGDFSLKTTVYRPVAETPEASKYGVSPAFDALLPTYCFMLATTSAAVSVLPSWNLTPLRIWNVHTVAFAFGFQLVASDGTTCPFGFVNVRYSPGMLEKASAPPSLSRYGSMGPAGAVRPTRIVPPALPAARRVRASGAAPASPTRPSNPPSMPTERPNMAPRLRNSSRLSSPLTSSSMTLFSSGPASLRRYSSMTLRVSLSIRDSFSEFVAQASDTQ